MKFDEFEAEFPEVLRQTNPATVRSWKLRGTVPDSVANQARALQSPVAKVPEGVAKPKSVAKAVAKGEAPVASVANERLGVAFPSAEKGHPEFDIMDDGWARGFPCDVALPQNRAYRTAHAIRRFCERGGIEDAAGRTKEFWDHHSESQELRLAFFKKLDAEARVKG